MYAITRAVSPLVILNCQISDAAQPQLLVAVLQRSIHRKGTLSKGKVNSRTSAAKSTNEITFYLKKSNGFYSR